MKFMVLLVTVAAVAALPRKSNKDFPKKYNAALDGEKHTYTIYSYAPNEDMDVPAPSPFLDDLVAPSSYDAYFEQEPQDSILPPEGSTYIGVSEMSEGDELIPPPEDTYSSHAAAAGLSDLAPPPVSVETSPSQTSYVTYEDSPQESLTIPELSSYAQIPSDKAASDVLEYLVAMIKAMPQTSSYAEIIPEEVPVDGEDAVLFLSPPQVEDNPVHSSYADDVTDESDLTTEPIPTEGDESVAVPSLSFLPPGQ
ncbi:uncharacterized protein [Procambarus clarkii]|uniref:uncharacterized protein n=1 Tax=Procambarus clarkii TaxID=6728 RepID=UPI001E671545|nr:uncharacterized protein LOC123771236 [Procambarus clarkii]